MLPHYDIVVYHEKCTDGEIAALLYAYFVAQSYPTKTTRFIPCAAGKTPELDMNIGTSILFLDQFPCSLQNMMTICAWAEVMVIDHHKTSVENCKILQENSPNTFVAMLDMKKCGAQLVWDQISCTISTNYLTFSEKYPWIVDVVADRDLWIWKYEALTKPLGEYLFGSENGANFKHSIHEDIPRFTELLFYNDILGSWLEKGRATLSAKNERIQKIVQGSLLRKVKVNDQEYTTRIVFCDHFLASDVGNSMMNLGDCDFALCIRYDFPSDRWFFSCRSLDDKTDVSMVAKFFDLQGGGHRNSAGFELKNKEGVLQKMLFE